MTRAALYARYSSDNQRDASIADQMRACRTYAEGHGWRVVAEHSDRAVSGTSLLRPGYQALLEQARNREVDVILAEALDRLSRDQEETAALFKRLQFFGVELITVAEGPISELHVGLKGTMNALYLKDLAQKTRRGLEGRVREGRSGGGLCYGYDVVRERDRHGDPVRGGRSINEQEATIVRRIFTEFTDGRSPQIIARQLNAEGVPGPSGRDWGPTTIYGNWRRGTGIINNELYVGRLIWNRLRYTKDPSTGKRVSQVNPETDWVITEVPELRIVEDSLWQKVKERQESTRKEISAQEHGIRSERARRPRYLLSGLLKCGRCGGGFSMVGRTAYGCSTARNKGTCDNLLTLRRGEVEERVATGLREKLMQPDQVKLFVAEYNAEMNRLIAEKNAGRSTLERDLAKAERELRHLIDAIKSGIDAISLKSELQALEQRKADLERELATSPKAVPSLHPGLAEVYQRKVDSLLQALADPGQADEARVLIRALIDEVRLTPEGDSLRIELFGELAALIALSNEKQPQGRAKGLQLTLVAGARCKLYLPTVWRPLVEDGRMAKCSQLPPNGSFQ